MTIILPCNPLMADVISDAIPRPRERRKRENAYRWLVDTTPAWPRVLAHLKLDGENAVWPEVHHRPDIVPPASAGLDGFSERYVLTWLGGAYLLCLNEDGTRAALVSLPDALAEAWRQVETLRTKLARPTAGRQPSNDEPPNAEAARVREYRRRKKLEKS